MKSMKPASRRQISIRDADYRRAAELRDALQKGARRPVSLTDIIGRAIDCLSDAHARRAWLSPTEAAPLLEQRHRDQVVSVVAQLVARLTPERALRGIAFDTAHDMLLVHFADGDPLGLVMPGSVLEADCNTEALQ